MTVFLVMGHIGVGEHRREYTHYVCKERHNAERLARILEVKRPDIMPVTVVQMDDFQERPSTRFADDSQGPK